MKGLLWLLLTSLGVFISSEEIIIGQDESKEESSLPHLSENDEYQTDVAAGESLKMGGSSKLVAPYAEQNPEYKRVCIYPNWSILRESNMAKIYPEDIDPNLCTHIHYAYANIDVRTLQLSPSQYQDFNSGDHGAVRLIF